MSAEMTFVTNDPTCMACGHARSGNLCRCGRPPAPTTNCPPDPAPAAVVAAVAAAEEQRPAAVPAVNWSALAR